jgi:hypothetical protein
MEGPLAAALGLAWSVFHSSMDRNFALTTKTKRITAKIIGLQSARDFEGVCSDVVALVTEG